MYTGYWFVDNANLRQVDVSRGVTSVHTADRFAVGSQKSFLCLSEQYIKKPACRIWIKTRLQHAEVCKAMTMKKALLGCDAVQQT
jgi:hypothetical protein